MEEILNPFAESIGEGLSIFTAVRDRWEMLKNSLPTWLAKDEVDEIIIVDWGSDENLEDIKGLDKRIVYARVNKEPYWINSMPSNFASRLTTRKNILKLDCDIMLKEDFFRKNILVDGQFIAGNWRNARNKNELSLTGALYCRREDFLKNGGYPEFLRAYGYEDRYIFERLAARGLRRVDVDIDTLVHQEHDDGLRILNHQSGKNAWLANKINIARSFIYSNIGIKWEKAEYHIRIKGENSLLCERIKPVE